MCLTFEVAIAFLFEVVSTSILGRPLALSIYVLQKSCIQKIGVQFYKKSIGVIRCSLAATSSVAKCCQVTMDSSDTEAPKRLNNEALCHKKSPSKKLALSDPVFCILVITLC